MIYCGLLLFFVLEYVRPSSYVPALLVLPLNSIVPVTTFVATVVSRGRTAFSYIAAESNTRVIGLLLFLVGMSLLTADVTLYAYTALSAVAGYALVYWVMMSELTSVDRIKGLCKVLVGLHVAVAALNPILFLDPGTRHYVSSGAFLGDGNDFALSVNIAIPLCLGLLLDARRLREKLLWSGALLTLVACIVLTESRGGTIALLTTALYYCLKSDRKVQTLLVVGLLTILVFLYAPAAYFERIQTVTNIEEGSAAGRLGAWRASIAMAKAHPIFGVGAGHFGVKYGVEYRPADAAGPWMTAHSLYFLALGELGFPGLALILYFVIGNLRANRRVAAEVRAANFVAHESAERLLASSSAALVGFAAGAAFLSCLYYPHLYVLCGLLGATRHVLRVSIAGAPETVAEPTAVGVIYPWEPRNHVAASR